MKPSTRNPWGLTKREADALTALIEYGTGKAAGEALGVLDRSIEGFVNKAKKRMGLESRVQMAVHWDRWMRSPEYIAEATAPALIQTVVDLIAQGEATDIDAIASRCTGHSRMQVKFALRNAVGERKIRSVGWAKSAGGRRMAVYAIGARPDVWRSVGRVNSVFQMGERAGVAA